MELKFSPKTLGESLLLLAKGMLGIFVVIGAIILIVYILNKVTKKKEQ
ncbi:MAG: oxaloacetate decarboxylase [Eubacteriales bacterium]|nr:oxaloacetate decarboxylase [Eubacteriales bacterium]